VLTEAKAPKSGFPSGWNGVWLPGGVGKRRPFGTVIAGNQVALRRTEFRRRKTKSEDKRSNPATTFCVDAIRGGDVVFRIFGHYGLMLESMNGLDSLAQLNNEIDDVISEYGETKLVVAGDFNLWPDYVTDGFKQRGLTSVTDLRDSFPKLDKPLNGTRIWTHKNGPKQSDGTRQELDFIFMSPDLVDQVDNTKGGVGDFPDAWEMSDHAPIMVDLKMDFNS